MNIYVGNLSYEVTVEDLHKAFEAFGQVESVNIIKDKFSGRSKGFGFVEMPDKANAQSLQGAFEAFGQVESVNIIKDKFSGGSKGFGFVEMPDKANAQSAINELNGKELKGRTLNVNEAPPRWQRRIWWWQTRWWAKIPVNGTLT
jgi:RNA recognition motif-containing protein